MRIGIVTALIALSVHSTEAEEYPASDWMETRDPIASPNAVKGGAVTLWGHSYPQSMNAYLDSSASTVDVFGLMYSSLLGINSLDSSFEPNVIRKWDISEDKSRFTLHIDPRARWSDGKPITARDIRWTYDVIMDPKNLTGANKVGLTYFEPPEVLDERTIRFVAKEVHWRNLLTLAGFQPLPQHDMTGKDFNKINFDFPVVSGPYRIKQIREGFSLTMVRNRNWWKIGSSASEGIYNFDEIKLRYIEKREDAYAEFLKGEMELYAVYTSRIWVKETVGQAYDKNWIIKKRVFNSQPTGLQVYILNLRNPLFQDVRVRKALQLLYDRKRMNETIMYNQYGLHHSYYEDIYDREHPNPHPVIPFDPEKARTLLDDAGWVVNPATGIREKDGKPFIFRFLYRDPTQDKFLTIYEEALRDAGIQLIRERKDFTAWSKDLDEQNFEASQGVWRMALFKDAETMWHSKEASRRSGQNYSGFMNDEVDRLIEQAKSEFDVRKRRAMLRKIDAILVKESPYVLEWYADNTRLLYWNKFGMPDTVLDKYSDEACIYRYWWYDDDKAEELVEARENGFTLPAEPVDINFDKIFNR